MGRNIRPITPTTRFDPWTNRIQTSFGTILPFHTAPTSLPTTVPSDTIPQQCSPRSGTNPYKTQSIHLSLYKQLRNPSPAHQPPTSIQQDTVGGETLEDSRTIHREQAPGNDSLSGSVSSHNPHQSYLHPPSHAMETGQARQAAQTLLGSHHVQPHHSPIQCQTLMGSMSLPSHPLSRRAITPLPSHLPTPVRNIHTDIHAALRVYEEGKMSFSPFSLPQILLQAEYSQLYSYFAYKLPFISDWGTSPASNDYFMKKQQGLPADDVLQYEAEQNARLLFNDLHPDTPMWPLTLYEDALTKIDTQQPMPDEPPVAPPRVTTGTFYHVRGMEPPRTYAPSYVPFTGADLGQPSRPPTLPPAPI